MILINVIHVYIHTCKHIYIYIYNVYISMCKCSIIDIEHDLTILSHLVLH